MNKLSKDEASFYSIYVQTLVKSCIEDGIPPEDAANITADLIWDIFAEDDETQVQHSQDSNEELQKFGAKETKGSTEPALQTSSTNAVQEPILASDKQI